jgi:hypothetical protein
MKKAGSTILQAENRGSGEAVRLGIWNPSGFALRTGPGTLDFE